MEGSFDLRNQSGDLSCVWTEKLLQLLVVAISDGSAEYLDERPVSGRTATLPGSTPQHTHLERGCIVGDLLGETSLADAWLTAQ
jgi:hypothetical protein